MQFNEWVNKRRLQDGYTLQELADKVGTSKSYIWEIENSEANPSLDMIEKIAKAFGLEVWRLLKQLEE